MLQSSVITQRLRDYERNSEILIGWAQLCVVFTFGALYLIARKTSPMNGFEPVPIALAAYLLLTLHRLYLAYRDGLHRVFIVGSIFIDVGLLFGLIWTFHIQYGQPAAFYLKAPTFSYIFIFIAMRALRFSPGYLMLMGAASALGWAVMTVYAAHAGGAGSVTRSFIDYMTGNQVLIGAEFDKIMTMLAVTVVLVIVQLRARRLLVDTVNDQAAMSSLSRFVPGEVYDRIRGADDDLSFGRTESREATVLFADLQGFTAFGERVSPEDLVSALNEYFTAVAQPIHKHGGVITQFQGDAILATFNLPRAVSNHAEAAVAAGVEILQVVERGRFGAAASRLVCRIGINTGMLTGGLVGTPDRLNYTVHGDAVNVAARLEQLNKTAGTQLLVAERTRELAGAAFEFQTALETPLRGRRTPLKVFAVVGAGRPPGTDGNGRADVVDA